ncbi:MAG TPA: GNAT family N-acetyltransferase [Xanthobacteraceae bacterium]|jgi:phosphinothricin acetyltransferase|nr:GNAT family N-acetyltransferase [Xanthobacteraceae bacterium]
MSEVSIRGASPKDIPAITHIYADAVAHGTASFELESPDEAEIARRQERLLANGYPYLVAELAGAIAGYAYAGPYRARPAYKWTVENSIYVAPRFHRCGIGLRLLKRLIVETEQRGFRQMIAVIGDSAQMPSIALHAAAGFDMIGTLRAVGFKHGKWLDTPLMQLTLGKGDTAPP